MLHRFGAACALALLVSAIPSPACPQDFRDVSDEDGGTPSPATGSQPKPEADEEEDPFAHVDLEGDPAVRRSSTTPGVERGSGASSEAGDGQPDGIEGASNGALKPSRGVPRDPDFVTLTRLGMPPEEWEDFKSLRDRRRYSPAHYYNRSIGGHGQLITGWVMTMGGLVLAGMGGVFILKAPPDPGDNCDDVFEDCWGQSFTRSLFLTEGSTFIILGSSLAIAGGVLIGVGERRNNRWIDKDSDLEGASEADFERYRRQGPWPSADESGRGPHLQVTPVVLRDGGGAQAAWTF